MGRHVSRRLSAAADDIVVHEHWHSSGSPIPISTAAEAVRHEPRGPYWHDRPHICIEATGRFATELGYHVTSVKDATADFSPEAMHAAHAINGPTYAHVITTTDELIAELTGGAEI